MATRWTPKQLVFIEEYLHDYNATQAAIRAGYSAKTAYQIGHNLLKKVEVQEKIAERLNEKKLSTDEILTRLADIARASPETFLTIEERPDGLTEWKVDLGKAKKENSLHLIKKIVPTRYGLKIELHDPLRALELAGRAQKLFTDRYEVEESLHVEGLNEMLERVYRDEDD